MEHLKRIHTMGSSNAPNQVDARDADDDEDSVMGSWDDDSSVEEMESFSVIPLEKASLMGKLQELEKMKEREVAKIAAKFDRDIDALKIVLSLK